MALRVCSTEPSAVALPFGDAYLGRLALEHRRLEHLAAAATHEITKREAQLLAGLTSRNLTRLHLDGLTIRRVGRNGLTVE